MKSAILLVALTVATLFGSSFASSEAEARGWGRGFARAHVGFHHRHFVRIAPVYPVVYTGVCRWFHTPYGMVKRCYY